MQSLADLDVAVQYHVPQTIDHSLMQGPWPLDAGRQLARHHPGHRAGLGGSISFLS